MNPSPPTPLPDVGRGEEVGLRSKLLGVALSDWE